jgi:tetratricopeptide (TPR) repeat protein
MARRVGDNGALAAALQSRRRALHNPEHTWERTTITAEILNLAEQAQDKLTALSAHHNRLTDLLELGDIDGAEAELKIVTETAEQVRVPRQLWLSALAQAMFALFRGRFAEGDELAQQALALGQRAHAPDAGITFAAQRVLLRREQGRMAEMEGVLTASLDQFAAFPPITCGLAYLYAEAGREAEARDGFEKLARHDFDDLPADAYRAMSLAMLTEVCAILADTRRASVLYDMLLPYADRNIVVTEALCLGSAARCLGLLSATMGHRDRAAEHFEQGLSMNTQIGARPWLAETQHNYAELLLQRGQPDDRTRARDLLAAAAETAKELGMLRLTERAVGLRTQLDADGGSELGLQRNMS